MGERIYKKIIYFIDCFMDIIFPKPSNCSFCGRVLKCYSNLFMCRGCLSQVKILECNVLDISKDYGKDMCLEVDRIYSVCIYEGIGREMVHKLKYKDKRNIALSIAAMMRDVLHEEKFDLIIPVPISDKKLKKRGYNQAELIARELSELLDVKTINGIQRIKDTPSQVLLNEGMRWYNVKGAFRCDMDLSLKAVLLVDDIITTGATIYHCTKELKASGALSVTAISFAKSKI